ncbi:retrovirus-related pol polyprotein from transposon TNT 1-94, partial [Tanacetum coccineum]
LKCSTSKSESKPTGNKRNDRMSQTPSRNMKNKVEAQPRKVNKKNHVVEPICDDNVKYLKLNANSDLNCATCKKSLFDDVHDKCLLDFVKNVNSRAKSAKKHKKNIWKPTCHVFTEVRFKWKPTRKTFTIVGYSFPLTRFTTANVVPPKKTTSHSVETQKPEGSNATDIPSSSSLVMTGCPDCSLVSGLRMFKTHDRESLSAHELSARTMLTFSKALLFLWAEAINTACYTQNRSIIRSRYNKAPYEIMQEKKLDVSFFHVFGALCYPTNDNDDLGKLDAKADIGIFIGYAPAKKTFRIYNKRT